MINNFDEIIKNKKEDIPFYYNLHTHNYLCGHAQGEVKDYVKEAVDKGLKVIGISDHIKPTKYDCGYIDLEKIDNLYLPQFDEAFKLYSNDIKILKGGEIEFFRDEDDFYKELLKRLDYLVLGQHVFLYKNEIANAYHEKDAIDEIKEFYSIIMDGIKSGYFKVFAHPDFYSCRYIGKDIDEVIKMMEECIKEASKRGMMVEINVNGIRNGFRYPTDELINICLKHNVKVIISSDAHKRELLVDDNVKNLMYYCKKIGLNIATLEDINELIK